jgi:phosphosulfolactate synthase
MNFDLPHIPARGSKPRHTGITSVMDKGLSLREAEDLIAVAGHLIDIVKIGFGTSIVSHQLQEKITLYRNNNIQVYFGGTLFEAFYIRNMKDEYKKYLDSFDMELLEISDGSMYMEHKRKCNLIAEFAKDYRVISEVGSKDASVVLTDEIWISEMRNELEAGAWKVIAEARESGNVGIYDKAGKANSQLVKKISEVIEFENIIWEAPKKNQQVWFIKEFGHNVNLGNISPVEVIPLETLRIGLRGDTFQDYLPKELLQ